MDASEGRSEQDSSMGSENSHVGRTLSTAPPNQLCCVKLNHKHFGMQMHLPSLVNGLEAQFGRGCRIEVWETMPFLRYVHRGVGVAGDDLLLTSTCR